MNTVYVDMPYDDHEDPQWSADLTALDIKSHEIMRLRLVSEWSEVRLRFRLENVTAEDLAYLKLKYPYDYQTLDPSSNT